VNIGMKRLAFVLFSCGIIGGCTMSAQMPASASAYQFLNIEGKSYFMDAISGTIYKVERHEDGSLDIYERAGQVGLKSDAI